MDELYGVGKDGHGPFRESHQTRGAENQDRGGLNTFYKKKTDDIFISKVDARSSGGHRARLQGVHAFESPHAVGLDSTQGAQLTRPLSQWACSPARRFRVGPGRPVC
jgi:hypothetical protein